MKINKKGFTLIELIAVIVIMGILMMIAIPAVSRTIENSRKEAFVNVAKNYLKAIKTNISTDDVQCLVNGEWEYISGVPDGVYYFMIDSTKNGTQELMESGGKSPWGNKDVRGYVKWEKKSEVDANGNSQTKFTYKMVFTDSGKVGFTSELGENSISKGRVSMNNSSVAATYPSDENAVACALTGFSLEYSDVEFTVNGVQYKSAYPTWGQWVGNSGLSSTENNAIWIGCESPHYIYKKGNNTCSNPGEYIYEEGVNKPIKSSEKIKQGVNYLSDNVCFAAGTKVELGNGVLENIEDINIGDFVSTYNITMNRYEKNKVIDKFKTLTYREMVTVYVGFERIKSTSQHLYYVKNKGWVKAKDLRSNDILLSSDGTTKIVSKVVNNGYEKEYVYNLDIDANNNYFVGMNKVLVHNAGGPVC